MEFLRGADARYYDETDRNANAYRTCGIFADFTADRPI